MKVVIIEDEKLSADHLIRLLNKTGEPIEVIAIFDSIKQTLEAFRNGIKADLLFVDIHLGDGLSFEIFHELAIDIPIIFTTAYDEYAIRAFQLNSVGYLLKPVALPELQQAIVKYKRIHQPHYQELLGNIINSYSMMNKQYKQRFMVRLGENIVSIKIGDVAHFLFEEGIVVMATKTNHLYPIDFTLDQLDGMLDPTEFFRINRKVIVNINTITKSAAYFNSRLKITTPNLHPDHSIVSRERVGDFKNWLGS